MDVYEKLAQLGIELPPPVEAVGSFLFAREFGTNMMYLSGAAPLPEADGSAPSAGRVGAELTLEQAVAAARSCAVAQLGVLHDALGDLNRIKRIVKVTGFINAAPGFNNFPAVLNGFSDTLVEVLGEKGRHARTAVGASVYYGLPMEIEMMLEIEDAR